MIRPIVRDPLLLAQKSEPATPADVPVAADLAETLLANREECVGMAANMVGVCKCIIVFFDGLRCRVMLNPVILQKQQPYAVQEGCLSLPGVRKTTRYRKIRVQFRDTAFALHTEEFSDFTARIIQHEVDHCNGILI